MRYFRYFPRAKHSSRELVDITKRTRILEGLLSDPYIYLPYTVTSDDKPEDVAHLYYQDVGKTWLIYMANNIIDPYSEWPLSMEDFYSMLRKKYETQSGETGNEVIHWTQNTQIEDNIVHCVDREDESIRINYETYKNDPSIIQNDWRVVRIYEHENNLNEDKRSIFLIAKDYASQIEDDLEELMGEEI